MMQSVNAARNCTKVQPAARPAQHRGGKRRVVAQATRLFTNPGEHSKLGVPSHEPVNFSNTIRAVKHAQHTVFGSIVPSIQAAGAVHCGPVWLLSSMTHDRTHARISTYTCTCPRACLSATLPGSRGKIAEWYIAELGISAELVQVGGVMCTPTTLAAGVLH